MNMQNPTRPSTHQIADDLTDFLFATAETLYCVYGDTITSVNDEQAAGTVDVIPVNFTWNDKPRIGASASYTDSTGQKFDTDAVTGIWRIVGDV